MNNPITEHLAKSDDDLYKEIGDAVISRGLRPVKPEVLIRIGKEWLSRQKHELSTVLCTNDDIRNLFAQARIAGSSAACTPRTGEKMPVSTASRLRICCKWASTLMPGAPWPQHLPG